jgi:hypothetical protein
MVKVGRRREIAVAVGECCSCAVLGASRRCMKTSRIEVVAWVGLSAEESGQQQFDTSLKDFLM